MSRVLGKPYEVFRWNASYGTLYRLVCKPKADRNGDQFTIEKLDRDALRAERWVDVASYYKPAGDSMHHELCEALVQANERIPKDSEPKGQS